MDETHRHRRHTRVREAAAPRYAPEPQAEGIVGVLLDSDIIIEILRGRRWAIEAAAALDLAEVPVYCCAISWAEVYAGLRAGEEEMTEAFFDARGEVLIDSRCGRRAGSYLARHARSHRLELADALMAAAASTSGLRLWTRNRRDYPMDDLRFYEP